MLTLGTGDLVAVAKAVRAVDPDGDHVTPVAVVAPSGQGDTTTVGVVPERLPPDRACGRESTSASLAWDRLTAPTVPPLVLTGTRVTYHLDAPAFDVVTPAVRPAPTALALALRVVRADGVASTPSPWASCRTDGVVARPGGDA